jgi:heptosyltransferase-2
MRSIGALSGGARVASAPDWDARSWSVLYLRAQGIGDMILATGVLRAIARSHPTIALDVLTTPAAAPVLDQNPHVRRIHVLAHSAGKYLAVARALRASRYDVVIDGKITRGASFIRSPALTMISRAPYRIGVGGGNHHLVYNLCVAPFDRTNTHMVEGSALLASPFGVDLHATDFRPEIFLTGEERSCAEKQWLDAAGERGTHGGKWLVNLSAGGANRRWPYDRWIALLTYLRVRRPTATIGVMGVDAEWDAVRHVAREGGAVAVAAPRLRNALALTGTCEHVITSNTSITHAASAFSVPTMLLLEQGEDQWASWKTPSEVAYWSASTVSSLDIEAATRTLDRFLFAHPETAVRARTHPEVSPASSASYPLNR